MSGQNTNIFKDYTVGDMIELLKQYPAEYRLDFSPGDVEDVTERGMIQVLEGTTSDGPGTVWIVLQDSDHP